MVAASGKLLAKVGRVHEGVPPTRSARRHRVALQERVRSERAPHASARVHL